MPSESPELIEQRIGETRAAMTARVSVVRDRTVGTVRETLESVNGIVDSVTGTAGEVRKLATPEAIGEVFHHTIGSIPVSSTVRRQPWESVGGAVLAGFITGLLTTPRGKSTGTVAPAAMNGAGASRPNAFSRLVDRILDRVAEEVQAVATRTIQTTGAAVTEKVNQLLPNDLRTQPVTSPIRSSYCA